MTPNPAQPRQFPTPCLYTFVALQVLDALTTMIGLRAGAQEGSFFIGQLMRLGPVSALAISKLIASVLVCLALRYQRTRLIVFMNYWFTAVVTWNLAAILYFLFHHAA